MKKTSLSLLISAFFIISNIGVAVQADEVDSHVEIAGVTPNEITYGIDRFLEKVSIAFTFSDEAKIEKLIEFANERLAEGQVMVEKEEVELSEKALAEYNETISNAQDKLQELLENSEKPEEDTETKLDEVQEKVISAQEEAENKLDAIQELLPEESREVVAEIKALQEVRKEAVRAMVEARHEFNSARKEYTASKVALKKVEKQGDEASVKQAQEGLKVAEELLNEKKIDFDTAFKTKQAVIKETNKARKALVKQMDSNSVETEEEKEKLDNADTAATIEESVSKIEINSDTVDDIENIVNTGSMEKVKDSKAPKEGKENRETIQDKGRDNNSKNNPQEKGKAQQSKVNKKK